MTAPRLTGVVVVLALVLLLGWEAWTLVNAHPGDTISEAIWNATSSTPLVPFGGGMLCGHWWFTKDACVHCGKRPWA